MKTLKTNKESAAMCWNGLRNIPPKAFNSVDLDNTMDIINVLGSKIEDFIASIFEGERIKDEISVGIIKEEDVMGIQKEFTKKSTLLEMQHGKDEIELEFTPESFNTFFQHFQRFGQVWFYNIESLMKFKDAMNVTNKQPK